MKYLYVGADHAGFALKSELVSYLNSAGSSLNLKIVDLGTNNSDSVDYPDFAEKVAQSVGVNAFGLLICGSGQGMAIKANRYGHVRAALCWSVEIAELARKHNNANVLCLPGRFVSTDLAKEILQVFLHTDFEGGRHAKRVDKL
ncbi:MAG: ribose 5-phosphate isomerase B [Bdellovibrionales bacterium CG10_big_fil_rev_8_21_14_0_10_45_34]|nr:MAG: ribose 5-phosphate isomerase B [Bdellovibrionales bacterium CG10_big_fil_rev_8_21_14_0_10_45_34]